MEQAEQQRGEHRAAGRADVGFGQRAVAARAVPVGQDGLGDGEQDRAGEAEDSGAEHGQGDRAGRAEQGGASHGAGRRGPQQRRPGQAAREPGEADPGEGRAGRPQRRIHAEHGVGEVQFGLQQGEFGPVRVEPERVDGDRAVTEQRRRVPAEGLAAAARSCQRRLAGACLLAGVRGVSVCVSIHNYSVGHGSTTEPAHPAPGPFPAASGF